MFFISRSYRPYFVLHKTRAAANGINTSASPLQTAADTSSKTAVCDGCTACLDTYYRTQLAQKHARANEAWSQDNKLHEPKEYMRTKIILAHRQQSGILLFFSLFLSSLLSFLLFSSVYVFFVFSSEFRSYEVDNDDESILLLTVEHHGDP